MSSISRWIEFGCGLLMQRLDRLDRLLRPFGHGVTFSLYKFLYHHRTFASIPPQLHIRSITSLSRLMTEFYALKVWLLLIVWEVRDP